MSKTRLPVGRPLVAAAASLLLAGALSGCGVAGTDFHPGVAAQVGDESISVSTVNSVASSYCNAIVSQLQSNNQIVPLRYLRGGVAGQLALLSGAQQLADQYGVQSGQQYQQKLTELQAAVASLPSDQQDAVIKVESSSTYISDIELAVGEQVLAKSGGDVTSTKATKAGRKAFAAWLDDQDVSINPEFGVEIRNAQAVPTDTSVSYALGETARNGDARQPDQSYAAGLPESHRCG